MRVYHRQNRHRRRSYLYADYELELSALSDDYTPHEITAEDLFQEWIPYALKTFPTGIIPIYWSLAGTDGIHDRMPGLLLGPEGSYHRHHDLLCVFTHPIRVDTGEPLRWTHLPVRDEQWNSKRWDKGGFIQEATGWKPSVLQSFVLIDLLIGTFSDTLEVRGADIVSDFLSSLEEEEDR